MVSVGFGIEIDTPSAPREYSGAAASKPMREQPQHGVAAGKGRQRQSVWFGGGKSKRSGPGEGGGAKVIPSKHKFGTPLDACSRVHSYACDVPQALVELWKAMLATPQGLDTEGIFRLTPDADDCTEVERQLTSGTGLLVPAEHGPRRRRARAARHAHQPKVDAARRVERVRYQRRRRVRFRGDEHGAGHQPRRASCLAPPLSKKRQDTVVSVSSRVVSVAVFIRRCVVLCLRGAGRCARPPGSERRCSPRACTRRSSHKRTGA